MFELIVIGGGPAGLAAACRAWEDGLRRILVVERDKELGGILNQCIHNGFGLHRFQEELTGPEYAGRFLEMLRATGVQVQLDTMALQLVPGQAGAPHTVHCVSAQHGYQALETAAVVLAMGCRERTRGAIAIPGERPSGIFTAGTAQRYLNMEGYMVGRRVVILGSGDIGLIMARRMSLEGAKVLACVELMPYSSGLTRNIVQCLQDYGIPLYLSHTVTGIRGHDRLEQVTVSRVDEQRMPIPGTEMVFECDTLLLSVGLIPENELTRQAGICMDTRTGEYGDQRAGHFCLRQCGACARPCGLCLCRKRARGRRGRSLCAGGPAGGQRCAGGEKRHGRQLHRAAACARRCAQGRSVLPRKPCAGCLAHCGAGRRRGADCPIPARAHGPG